MYDPTKQVAAEKTGKVATREEATTTFEKYTTWAESIPFLTVENPDFVKLMSSLTIALDWTNPEKRTNLSTAKHAYSDALTSLEALTDAHKDEKNEITPEFKALLEELDPIVLLVAAEIKNLAKQHAEKAKVTVKSH